MTTETWRVPADHSSGAVAHLVTVHVRGATGTACNWVPSAPSRHIDRAEMLRSCRWVCIRCARAATHQLLRRAT